MRLVAANGLMRRYLVRQDCFERLCSAGSVPRVTRRPQNVRIDAGGRGRLVMRAGLQEACGACWPNQEVCEVWWLVNEKRHSIQKALEC